MNVFRRIFRPSPATIVLLTGQRKTYVEKKGKLQGDIDFVTRQPTGYVVRIEGVGNLPKDDWLTDAATEMVTIDQHIADLDQYI